MSWRTRTVPAEFRPMGKWEISETHPLRLRMRGWRWVDLNEITGMTNYAMQPFTLLKLFIGGEFSWGLGAPVMITPLRDFFDDWVTHILRPKMEISIPETVVTLQPWSPETLGGKISWVDMFSGHPTKMCTTARFFFNDAVMKEEHPVMVPRRWGLAVLKDLRRRPWTEIDKAAGRIVHTLDSILD